MDKLNFLEKLLNGVKVEWVPLGEVAQLQRGTSITKKDITHGDIPVIAGGREPAYFHNVSNRNGQTIVIAGSGSAGFVSWWDKPIFVSDAFSIKTNNTLLARYCYHFLLNIQQQLYSLKSGGSVPHVYIKDVAPIKIPIPCVEDKERSLEIQAKIVSILDSFTELTTELTNELNARKKQYSFYRDQLLSFNEDQVQWKTLGEIGSFYSGLSGKNKSDFNTGNSKYIPFKNIFYNMEVNTDQLLNIKISDNEKQNNVLLGDVLFTRLSENYEESGMSSVLTVNYDKKLYLNSFCFGFRLHDKSILLPHFMKYLFRTNKMRKNIIKTAYGVTRFNISKRNLGKIKIPIPPIKEQERIVAILDKFDALTNSIQHGLPLEIHLRQKQYLFYRDLLFNFPT